MAAAPEPEPAPELPARAALAVRGLVKRYGSRAVLDGVDLTLAPGAFTVLAGANGAGKSTLLRVLATVERADAGALTIAGVDARADGATARRALGYAGHDAGVYPALTVREHVAFQAGFFDASPERVDAVANALGLTPLLAERADRLSRGQRQRLALARAIVGAPRVLLLDEPWTALDAAGERALDAALSAAAREGAAVLASSQDARAVAARHSSARVVRLERGRLVEVGVE